MSESWSSRRFLLDWDGLLIGIMHGRLLLCCRCLVIKLREWPL